LKNDKADGGLPSYNFLFLNKVPKFCFTDELIIELKSNAEIDALFMGKQKERSIVWR